MNTCNSCTAFTSLGRTSLKCLSGTLSIMKDDSLSLSYSKFCWDVFERAFTERYMGAVAQQALKTKFFSLKQNGRTIEEYQREFYSLSRYAQDFIPGGEQMCHYFIQGLDPEISVQVRRPGLDNMRHLVQHCEMVEQELKKFQQTQPPAVSEPRSKPSRKFRKFQGSSAPTGSYAASSAHSGVSQPQRTQTQPQRRQEQITRTQASSQQTQRPSCTHCGREGHKVEE